MLRNFRTYDLAVQFHRSCQGVRLPAYLRDQILRASSSIVLNLAEGSGKPTSRDRIKFYFIALGSLRECQAALDLLPSVDPALVQSADRLGGSLYRLCHQQQTSK